MWEDEDKLTEEERRARYRCPLEKVVVVSDLPSYADDPGWELDAACPPSSYDADNSINSRVCVIRGDIRCLECDAILNAANKRLLGGGGIDGAIHIAAGPMLFDECCTLGGAQTGQTRITRGYDLPAKYVLHTVGPVGSGDDELKSCYESSLQLVKKHNIKTVALCGVSTGIFGFPLERATRIALDTVRKWLQSDENRDAVDRIVFCTFLEKEWQCYTTLFPEYFPRQGAAD